MSLIDKLLERGMEFRAAARGRVRGDHPDSAAEPPISDFRSLIAAQAGGDVWTRPGLDRKTRSMLTIAFLAALGHHEELKLHIRATRNTGVSRDEVKEILLQAAIYAGVPAANSAAVIARQIYDAMDKEAIEPRPAA